MQERLYTSNDLAQRWGISRETVINWCKNGRLPGAYLYLGSAKFGWRIPEAAVYSLEQKGLSDAAKIDLPA